MIVQDSTLGELAKILDFGVAKLMQTGSDQTRCFMGTLAYASPEQMEGRELDNRSDIYSFGVMMFQMLTGHLPLRANGHTFGSWYQVHLNQTPKPISDIASDLSVPKLIDDLVMRCLAKRPEDRPQQVRDILKTLEPLESRFVPGFRMSQRISTTLTRLPVTRQPDPSTAVQSDQVCKLTVWPQDKPVAEIVFPHALPTSQGPLVTLWAMMPQAEITRRLVSTRYNTFICTMSPHPMMLWLTVLYSSTHGARWLPCYVDLKTSLGQQIAGLLKDTGSYKLLLFALESPSGCAHVLSCTIAGAQRGMLQEWALTAQTRPSMGSASISRDILRNEFKTKLKAKVLQKLEAIYVDTGSNLAE
jgi:serine/threonine protein kinase